RRGRAARAWRRRSGGGARRTRCGAPANPARGSRSCCSRSDPADVSVGRDPWTLLLARSPRFVDERPLVRACAWRGRERGAARGSLHHIGRRGPGDPGIVVSAPWAGPPVDAGAARDGAGIAPPPGRACPWVRSSGVELAALLG